MTIGWTDTVWYCAFFISGTQVTLTSTNTHCWDGSGVPLAASDVPKIDKAGLQVPSMSTAITLNNLCITKIVFGN
jgi:hypothetical protein